MNKENLVRFRCTDQQKMMIEENAARRAMTISAYMTSLVNMEEGLYDPSERIQHWRENCGMSISQMSSTTGIPVGTIKEWESIARPDTWLEDLVVEKLKSIARSRIEAIAKMKMANIPEDSCGNAPVLKWAVINGTFVKPCNSFDDALLNAAPGSEIGYIMCNIDRDGNAAPWYTDRYGRIHAEYDFIVK